MPHEIRARLDHSVEYTMSDGRALREGFASSVPQTTEDIERALKEGLLSLDANVLLNFYRYSPAARDALAEVLRAAGDRVWVSHQAAREFWRNRCTAIDSRDSANEQLRAALGKQESAALGAVNAWAKQTAVSGDAKEAIVKAISGGFAKALEAVETEAQGAGTVAYDITNDSVLKLLEAVLTTHVGPPLAEAEHESAIEEGERRAAAGIPPGFRDTDKTEAGGADGASGDYLVWLQSMNEAVNRGLDLVIVTGDEKEDWWWKHRSSFMGPRSELVEEFAQRSQKLLFMLRPVQLISHAAALNVTVSSEAEGDVARASTEDASSLWTRAAVVELLRGLDDEGREQADVIRFAIANGGSVDRDKIYEIAGYHEDRMLRGFTRPAARITKTMQDQGLVSEHVEPILSPQYQGGVTAVSFSIPDEVVDLFAPNPDLPSVG